MLDIDQCCTLLADLLHGLENRPISSTEKTQIELEIQRFVKDNNIRGDTPILYRLIERLSFSYFPTVSNLKNLSFEKKKTSVLSTETRNGMMTPSREQSKDMNIDYSILALQPAKADMLYICSVRRVKSALSASYRMSIDNTKSLEPAFISALNFGNDGKIYHQSNNELSL